MFLNKREKLSIREDSKLERAVIKVSLHLSDSQIQELREIAEEHYESERNSEETTAFHPLIRSFIRTVFTKTKGYTSHYEVSDSGLTLHTYKGILKASISKIKENPLVRINSEGQKDFVDDFYQFLKTASYDKEEIDDKEKKS